MARLEPMTALGKELKRMLAAQQIGQTDRIAGKPLSANPYSTVNHLIYIAWVMGWQSADIAFQLNGGESMTERSEALDALTAALRARAAVKEME